MEKHFAIDGHQLAELFIRLGVYDEKVLSEYVTLTDNIRFKLWRLRNSWTFIFPERFQRWLYKRHLTKLDTEKELIDG